ncbi:MAG TPA: subclass B3 metallo-beta-lactamase [Gammaproteobacteria bacterium]|jgi:metallo-beta-lactamase class B
MRPAAFLSLLACLCLPTAQALSPESAAKNQPQAPFRIAGDIYYVGASDVTSYLITTPRGMILLDGGYAETAPMIEKNIATLGFKLKDVKILLNGHAHPDHAGGLAKLKADSGARFEAMAQEVQPLEHEGQGTFYRGDHHLFDSIHVDRVLHDGDTVSLGGVTLTAHLTAGHTPGCTSWSMPVTEGGKPYSALFICQLTLPDKLLGNPLYPDAAKDYAHSFEVLQALPCDVFLAEHGSAFDLLGKYARLQAHPETDPFLDPKGCKAYLTQSRQEFETQLKSEQAAAHP